MDRRIELHELLVDCLGSRNVYFQPPETIKMVYPCIVYELTGIDTRYANDGSYNSIKSYSITVVDKDPDSEIPDRIMELPMTSFGRHYTADNLHHFNFKTYF